MLVNKKIKGFTLSEMLVVMVLTIIIISMAILVLNLVQNQLKGIQQNFSNTTELRTLKQSLWRDCNKGDVFYDDVNDQLICTSPIETVLYKFKEGFIIRNNDTLNIEIAEKKFFLDAKESKGIIDAVELKFSKKFQYRELFIYKTKAASFYMNN